MRPPSSHTTVQAWVAYGGSEYIFSDSYPSRNEYTSSFEFAQASVYGLFRLKRLLAKKLKIKSIRLATKPTIILSLLLPAPPRIKKKK
nr:hypothetical protein [Photobacterium phosphoreum]